MGLLPGKPLPLLSPQHWGYKKIPTNHEKVCIKTLFCTYKKKDWPWSVAQDVDQSPKSGQGESVVPSLGHPWLPDSASSGEGCGLWPGCASVHTRSEGQEGQQKRWLPQSCGDPVLR